MPRRWRGAGPSVTDLGATIGVPPDGLDSEGPEGLLSQPAPILSCCVLQRASVSRPAEWGWYRAGFRVPAGRASL